jgi:hypothetical protein
MALTGLGLDLMLVLPFSQVFWAYASTLFLFHVLVSGEENLAKRSSKLNWIFLKIESN